MPEGQGYNNGGDAGGGATGGAGTGATGGAAPEFSQFIPEEYRDKEWVKQNTKDPNDFFKWVDNQNQLLGRKGPARPAEGASSEEWDNYYKSLGRPETPDDYEFKNPEGVEIERDEQSTKLFKSLLFDAGVPKDMAEKLQTGYDKIALEQQKKIEGEQKTLNEAFDKKTKELFGDNKDTVVQGVKKLLKENADPAVLGKLESLDNEALTLLSSAVHGIATKYIGEDVFKGGSGSGAPKGSSFEELSKRQRILMAKPGFDDFRHPDYEKLQAENRKITEQMRSLNP